MGFDLQSLETISACVPGNFYWKNIHSEYIGCNQSLLKMLGFNSKQNIIGKTDYDLWPEQAEKLRDHDKYVMASRKTITLEETVLMPGKEMMYFTAIKMPLLDARGNVVGILGSSLDITEQKNAEMKIKKAEACATAATAKAETEEELRKTVMILVGDIVHDLRTPIATLRSIGVLLSSIFPELIAILDEAKELGSTKLKAFNQKKLLALCDNTIINSINSSVSMMDTFINSTLKELANAQKGLQADLSWDELTKCSSRRILENTIDAYPMDQSIVFHKNISYDFYLMGNGILIMKLLFNLLRNAIDQIHLIGKGELFIETCESPDANQIKVKDSAGGASPEVFAKMFDGYFTTKKGGTGIGLATCKKIMATFGGSLSVDNRFGESIEFILSFPKIAD